jgi:hypothetical protein
VADIREEVIIDIKLQKGDNERQVDNLTKSLTNLTEENKELIATNKELAKQGQQNSKEFVDNARQVEINKQKIQQNTASRKGLIQTIIAEDDSIKSLRVQNAQLIAQRDLISTKTDQGRAKIAQLNATIDKNNATINSNSSALEKQRFNIGNYQSALSGLSPALGAFVSQIQAATSAALLFISTPLGAVFAGLGLAILPVVSYLKNTGEGADIVAREMEGLKSVVRSFTDDVNELGKSVFEFFKNLTPVTENVNGIKSALELAREAGRNYADIVDAINDEEENYGITAAKTENQIKRLILEAKNRTLSEEERIKKLQDAVALESTLQTQREDFAKRELSALVELNRSRLEGAGIAQTADETQAQFAENNIDRIRDLDEGLATSLIKSLIKLEEAAGSSIAIEEKALNLIDKLRDDQEKKDKQRAEDREKQSEKEREQRIKDFDESIKQKEENDLVIIDLNKQTLDKLNEDYVTFKENEKKADEKHLEEKKKYTDRIKALKAQEASAAVALSNTLGALAARDSAAQKGFALTAIAINSGIGVSNAVKAGSGIPWPGNLAAILSGITAVLAGIAQAKNLLGFFMGGIIPGFAGGGSLSGTRIMAHHGRSITRSNGDDRLITAKVGETIVNERQKQALGGDRAFQRAGIPGYATGGIVANETRISTQQANQQLDLNQLALLLNQVQTVLVLQDFEAKQSSVASVQRRAQVI